MTAEQDDVQAPGEPPRVCEHGIRWPWACEDCDNAWEAARPQAEARPSEGEVGEAVERLSQLAKLSPNAFERAMEHLSADGLRRDIRDILAELRWVGTANERLARLGRAVERERDEAFAAKEAAESKLSVLVEEMAGVVEAAGAVVHCWGVGRLNISAMGLFVDDLRNAIASLQSPQEPTP